MMAPRRVKVCHIITRLIVGGAQENTILSCARVDQRQYDTRLITGPQTGREGSLHGEARALGVSIAIVPTLVRELSPANDLRALPALVRLLRAEGPDIVHTHSSKAGILGRAAAWLAGVPRVVHTVHGWSFHDYMSPIRHHAYIVLERAMARRTDRLIVVTHRDRHKGLAARVGRPAQYLLVRSGVDLTPFRDARESPAAVRATLGVPADARVIGSVIRLSAQKDPLTLVRAAAVVLRTLPDVYWIIVGDGLLRGEVEALAERLGIRDRICLTGIRRDIPALMRAFDVFVLSSLWEGLSRVIPQAMASGVPIVASAVDGTSDAIEDGVSGMLVPLASPDALAQRTIEILTNPLLAKKLTESGQGRAQEFELTTMIRQLEALYDELATGAGAFASRVALR